MVGEHFTGDAIKMRRWIKNITYFVNAVRNMGVPETIRAWNARQARGEEH